MGWTQWQNEMNIFEQMSFFLVSHPLTTLKKSVASETQVVSMWRIFYKKLSKNPSCKVYLISWHIHQLRNHGVIYNDRTLKNVWHILSIFIVGHYAYLKHNVELLLAKLFALVYDSKEKTILKNISYILLYYSLCIEMNFLYLSSLFSGCILLCTLLPINTYLFY